MLPLVAQRIDENSRFNLMNGIIQLATYPSYALSFDEETKVVSAEKPSINYSINFRFETFF